MSLAAGEVKGLSSKRNRIAAQLERKILAGEWKPNQQLPGIPSLAKEFGVSYGTIHGGLKKLAEKRLVIMEPGHGTKVLNNKTINLEWLCFAGIQGGKVPLVEKAMMFVQDLETTELAGEVSLSMSLLDIKNLPAPKTFAEISRARGIRGVLISGHSISFFDYLNKLSDYLPVVSMFACWDGGRFHYVAPDLGQVITEFINRWKLQGATSVGLVTPNLDHPNHVRLYKDTMKYSQSAGIGFGQNEFFMGDYKDTVNWMIGRLSKPDSPRHWIVTVRDHAKAILEAAEFLKFNPRMDLEILAFTSVKSLSEGFGSRVNFGVYQFEVSAQEGIKRLLWLVNNRNGRKKTYGPGPDRGIIIPVEIIPANS